MFRKRKGQAAKAGKPSKKDKEAQLGEKVMRLEYEMMLRCNVMDRPDGKVRPIGVTADVASKVGTSWALIVR